MTNYSSNTKFWMGIGIGSLLGYAAYRFSCSNRCKRMKARMGEHLDHIGEQAEEAIDNTKAAVANAGKKVADKVADKTFEMAEKADNLKEKVHSYAADTKKQ